MDNKERPTRPGMVRWHLECIPVELDKELRQRQLNNRRKYPCQQVVADLQAYYRIEHARKLLGDDIIEGDVPT
jgi:hypothetical protein